MSDDDMGDDMEGEEDFESEEDYEEEPSEEEDEDLAEILRELEGEEEETEEEPMDDEMDLDEVIAALREEEEMDSEEETEEDSMDEEIDLNELLNSLNEEEDEMDSDEKEEMGEGKKNKMKMKKMEEDLNEAYSAVKYLRSKLSEVNLLNAKLLYVNKLFRNNLTETQKVKIIETFDRAKTVREAKLVYSTLAESLSTKKTAVKTTTKKAVMEGLASAATKKTTVLTEGNDQVNRFKKLAGLI
jgi:chromosome segregation ATPase